MIVQGRLPSRGRRRATPCRGLTLVELLVVLAIVGVLAGLTLPAVQKSRAAAQRVSCRANLKQVTLAVTAYESAFGVFPASCGMPNVYRDGQGRLHADQKQFSAFTQVLPYLEQRPLFDALNFSLELDDSYLQGRELPNAAGNTTAFGQKLAVLLCPSDGGAGDPGTTGGTNVRVNLGTERFDGLPANTSAPLGGYSFDSPAATTDGLSQTAMLAEKLRGGAATSRVDPRSVMIVGGLSEPFTVDQSIARCRVETLRTGGFHTEAGLSWGIGTLTHTTYNHAVTPNETMPDCVLVEGNPPGGLFGTRSNHPGGVHVAMADGSVRFVGNGIGLATWRGLGTRAGGEMLGEQ